MSAIYNLEPQPTASAIIHTTQGEIGIELFAKQTPLTCRNFLQLSLDGYYDNTIFHRLVPGFILQGGDPTGTGHGGESIYDGGALGGDLDPWPMDERRGRNTGPLGVNFKDEFHSRLKFNRRGLLGMANESAPDTNSSQFFFTLGKAEELNGKNTLFGRVAGDTIYNLAKMGEAELQEGTERPIYPVKITRIEILVNPFSDMKKEERKNRQEAPKISKPEKKQKKRKGGKQLLSFGDEEGGMDDEPVIKKTKFDTRIVVDMDEEPATKTKPLTSSSKKEPKPEKTQDNPPEATRRRIPASPPAPPSPKESHKSQRSPEPTLFPKPETRKSLLERTNEEIAAVKASMKRTIHTTELVKEKKKSALEQLIPETAMRGRRRRPGAGRDDQEALDILWSFRSKLEQAPSDKNTPLHVTLRPEDGSEINTKDKQPATANGEAAADEQVCDLHFIAGCQSCQSWDKLEGAEDDSGDEGWMSHQLSFAADKMGKDLSYRKKADEELVVIDPLEKARTIQEENKARRDARVGGSSRAWDKGRKWR